MHYFGLVPFVSKLGAACTLHVARLPEMNERRGSENPSLFIERRV